MYETATSTIPTPADTVNLCDAARRLASQGWRVLPCHPHTKAPLIRHGFHEASGDDVAVAAWWSRWPTAMIGAVVPPAWVVLDVDPRNGGSTEALTDALGPLPRTLTVASGRGDGGLHLYYRRPAERLVSHGLPDGVDLKDGGKGYMLMPPSPHPATGRPYTWHDVAPVAHLPGRAREVLAPEYAADVPRRRTGQRVVRGGGSARALVATVATAPVGDRNALLFWSACRAYERDDADDVVAQLRIAARGVGLTEAEVAATLRSAAKTVGVTPR